MTRLNLSSLTFLIIAILAPYVLGSATKQFNLNLQTQASSCWMLCHSLVTSTIPLPDIKVNSYLYIDRNCRNDPYVLTLPQCLSERCETAPDAAYAIEYANSVCKRAGVSTDMALPEAYVEAAKDYFEGEEYKRAAAGASTSRGTRGLKNWGLDWKSVSAGVGLMGVVGLVL